MQPDHQHYRLAIDGDSYEKQAWSLFIQNEFPSYEAFWLKYVVDLSNRPANIYLKDDATLAIEGRSDEDIGIAQLHYTVMRHLLNAHQARQSQPVSELGLFLGLSSLTAAQDVAFELLEKHTHRGEYDPWIESRQAERGGRKSGQTAREEWKRAHGYPLQDIRDYRNKLIHGRVPPAFAYPSGFRLPAISAADRYVDWRKVTGPGKAEEIPPEDFCFAHEILNQAWEETLSYLEGRWQQHLLA
jgi:hypothetical protein